ncbi:N-6 DNA methylase [Pseudodesulfovibrio sp. S3]|uniref:Eco57I restriction-modification methylase domain-containing protein n=1 Tax=unclassified Pseudodesulfovibrio TaxID=2661612 RepID=UPI000FEBCFA0|nr:N-6 DNA methylase [Pseudodesulfovibrio sp. S3]MCJ2164640.1 Eco57I restriction-modification methylase domain-containing protein [Pseudodesulfovibrio sp. S3-i]RWU04168.1 type I restriction endonuclease subunit M [Pseudodesulfovibrio sp. S3]
MQNKENGRFYTPTQLALWISQRVLKKTQATEIVRILEPSCGDGVFLRSLAQNERANHFRINAVETDSNALHKAQESFPSAFFYNEDFLLWKAPTEYDIVLGNPPYINKKNLTSTQTAICKQVHIEAGLANREISNIWTSFVIKSSSLLSTHGILSFVIPTELLQVKYAQEIRNFLLNNFSRIEIISFRKLAFKALEQDTVILLAYKEANEKGFFFTEVDSIEELNSDSVQFTKHEAAENTKWTSFVLNANDLAFVNNLVAKCHPVSKYCKSVAGIVTAANNYFIVSEEVANTYSLGKYVKPIIQKGTFVNGSTRITPESFDQLRATGKPCYLLDLNGLDADKFNKGLNDYLSLGHSEKIPARYKCLKRKRWFDIPSIWKSEGFFFKRGHAYPKIIDNQADVFVTDAAYRIRMNEGLAIEGLIMSFYNSLTLLCSELFGRYYGGGVLELTPKEFRSLPLPYVAPKNNYGQFLSRFEKKDCIESFLHKNDLQILQPIDGMSNNDILRVHELYTRVKRRRLRG